MPSRSRWPALRITLVYILVAVLWTVLSDRLVEGLATDTASLSLMQTFKGWLFMLISGLLLYGLLRQELALQARTQASLEESEARYRAIFERSAVGIARLDRQGRIFEINDTLCQMLGYSREELLQRQLIELLHPDDREHTLQQTKRLHQGEISVLTLENRHIRRDGETVWTYDSVSIVRDSAGQIRYSIVVLVDVTPEIRAADAIRASEDKFAKVFHLSPDAMTISRLRDSVYLEVNQGFCNLTGYSVDEAVGHTAEELGLWARPEERAEFLRIIQRDGIASDYEALFRARDGVLRTGLISSVIIDFGGEPCGLAIVRDIHDRKQMEVALRHSAERLAVLHEIDVGILAARSVDDIVQVTLEQIHELIPVRRVSLVIFDPVDAKPVLFATSMDGQVMLSREQLSMTYDIDLATITAGVAWIEDLALLDRLSPEQQALLDAGLRAFANIPMMIQETLLGSLNLGKTEPGPFDPGHLTVARDVADQLAVAIHQANLNSEIQRYASELEERVEARTAELKAANEQLLELDRLKSKFVSDVSHELRTPITNLGMYLYLLERSPDEKRGQYLTVLQQQADRLKHMVEGILDLTRLDLGRAPVAFGPVDLNELVDQVVTAHHPRAEAARLVLSFTPDRALPLVRGERNQIAQVVTNLVVNAINYTPRGEVRVRVTVDEPGRRVGLEVADTGMGISPEDIPHIFERFYRGHEAVDRNIPGTGLGLGIVWEIVNLHGGTIEVESQVGTGTTFRVWLPVYESAMHQAASA